MKIPSCDCASKLKEKLAESKDEEVKRVIYDLEKKGIFALNGKGLKDKEKIVLTRSVVFLINFINTGKRLFETDSEDETDDEALIQIQKRNAAKVPEVKLKEEENKTKTEEIEKQGNVCFALKFNKCQFKDGNGCPNRHPEKCEKFCDFGHKSFDTNGCETKDCNLLHPKLCRNSAKLRECPHRNCRFQHLKGTKLVPKREFESARSARGLNATQEERNNGILLKKLEKLVELFTISIQINEEGKS